jgi:hypothetical protein
MKVVSLSNFSGISSLPTVNVNGTAVTVVGHHAVSVVIYEREFDVLLGALKNYGFDTRDFASNGVPLPNTLAGANATGMAAHIDSHPAYLEWQRRLFGSLNDNLDAQNFGALTREQWLQQTANEVNGFKAYVQTELMKPNSPLVLNWRELPDTETWQTWTPAAQAQIQSQFAARRAG